MYRKTLIISVIALITSVFLRYEKPSVDALIDISPVEAVEPVKAKKTQTVKQLVAKATSKSVQKVVAPVIKVTGDWVDQCYAWAKAAGVPLNDSAIKLLERESHCNPSAWNASSGAGGIPQALPFSKTGCALGAAGAVCQMKWFYNYCMVRYGSYEAALSHSFSYNWY